MKTLYIIQLEDNGVKKYYNGNFIEDINQARLFTKKNHATACLNRDRTNKEIYDKNVSIIAVQLNPTNDITELVWRETLGRYSGKVYKCNCSRQISNHATRVPYQD